MAMRKYCLLAVPFILALLVDAVFTLNGQPDSWWKGDYANMNELNPIGRVALSGGPVYAVFAFVFYSWVISSIIYTTPRYFSAVISLTATNAHIIAAHSWCETFNHFRVAMAASGVLAICVVQYLEETNANAVVHESDKSESV